MKASPGLLAILVGCAQPPAKLIGAPEDETQPDTAYAWQRVLERSLDSLKRPGCTMTWRADLGDSLRVCEDPGPPGTFPVPESSYFPIMPNFWKPGRSFQADEAIDAHAYLEELQALPDDKLELVAAIEFGPPKTRQMASIARRVQAWRRQVDGPFR